MYELVNSGSFPNSDDADTLRLSFSKINSNFLAVSASLNFSQSIAGSAGSSAGYIIIKINGTDYKLPIYNV
jgi:hypothetical protein